MEKQTPVFRIPGDGKDIVEIGGIVFNVNEEESSLSIPAFSRELLVHISFSTDEMEKGRQLELLYTYDFADEAETIGKFHIEFPALGVYHHGKPKGHFEIENGKYMLLHSYCRIEGFEYGLEFNGYIYFENDWVAFLGVLKKSYDDKQVFPVKIYKRFTTVPGLEWSNYKFTSMEEALQAPPAMVSHLQLNDPVFTELPEELLQFTNLKDLTIIAGWNTDQLPLKQLPEGIGALQLLESVSINKSAVAALPESIGGLHNLERFYLNISELTTIPEGFWKLPKLKYLGLSNGKLTHLPENMGLNKLESIDISGNRLKTIPEALCNLPSIRHINLDKNPLEFLPEAIRKVKEVSLALKDKKRLMDYSYKGAGESGVVKWKDNVFFAASDKELIKEVDNIIKKNGLSEHKKALRSLVKKAIALQHDGEEDYNTVGNHRFGGMPDLPETIAYPEFRDGYNKQTYLYEFIGQINCEAIAGLQDYLPRTGTLFFFLETLHSLYGQQDQNPCKVIYVADNDTLRSGKRFSFREDQYYEMIDGGYTAFKATAGKVSSAPCFYSIHTNSYLLQGDAKALSGQDELYDQLYETFETPVNGDTRAVYLVNGYVFTQHENPEMQAASALKGNPEDWTVLLKVPSAGDFLWGDAGDLFFVIHKSDLAKGDFRNVFAGMESS